MLQMIIQYLLYKKVPKPNYQKINLVRYELDVLPFYIITKNNFSYCMKNKLLKRGDILYIKGMIDNCIEVKYYKSTKFKNDAHEIYAKLSNKYITQEQMLEINSYIENFIPEELQIVNQS